MDKYQCLACGYIGELDEWEDLECDGDIIGTCPKCKQNAILVEVTNDFSEEKLIEGD